MSTTTCTLTNTTTSTTPFTASLSLTPSYSPMATATSLTPSSSTMEDLFTTTRRMYTTLSSSLLATIESHPLLLMTLQYATAASRAATIYLLSVIWTLAQSLVWMVTAESLDWIQSREFGPLILEWDSFLLGAVFLTVDIHPDSLEFHHAKKASCIWSSSEEKQHSRSSSQSSSFNHGGRRVTFDEQVMVLGRSGAVGGQHQQQRGFTPILINSNSCNSYSYIQDPHAVPTMTESPTRSTFAIPPTSAAPYCSSLSQEAEYLQRNYGYSYSHNYQYQYQHQYTDSPSSSRSNSCRSSICSVSSSESIDSFSSSDSAAKPTASSSTKSNSSASSRLAALFHHHTPRHNSTLSHSPPTSSASSIDSSNAQPSISGTTKSKNLVHRIMHPHQHKRELELQHQIEFQQQQQRRHTQPYHTPEFLDIMTEHEYQPSEHTRKTLKQRLGLNKKKSTSI